jgi:membrane protease subunit HflK
MRKRGAPSEIGRMAAPLAGVLDAAWQRMHWWIGAMALLYLLSGITIVRSDEVAVILRWGRLVGDAPGLQQHGPGLLFSFPRPIDRVVRVPVKNVREVSVTTLASTDGGDSFNPIIQGYALTGDQNSVHVNMMARYRVRSPAEWSFYGPKAEDVLRVEVTAAMVRSLGEMGVDHVLAEGRQQLVAITTRRAQAGLDAAHSGLEISSLELTRLAPPASLASDFDAVQSAFIGAETAKKEALAFSERAIPAAQTFAVSSVQAAQADSASEISKAKGESEAFRALAKEYRANPAVVRERLYRDAVEKAILAAGGVRWIPPPIGGSYHGLRITIGPTRSAPRAVEEPDGGEDR